MLGFSGSKSRRTFAGDSLNPSCFAQRHRRWRGVPLSRAWVPLESVLQLSITKNLYILEKDQLWQLAETHIKIVGVGKHLAHFKHCKTLDQKRVTIQLQSIVELQKYLKDHRGKLVNIPVSLATAA